MRRDLRAICACPSGSPRVRSESWLALRYLPFVIVGFMLAVPILTVSVLKGCWAVIDLVAPMQAPLSRRLH